MISVSALQIMKEKVTNLKEYRQVYHKRRACYPFLSLFARNKLSLKALYCQKSLKENANLVKWQICSLPRENSKLSINSPLRVFSLDISESTCL